ncbi:aminodeoxychorismate synthase, component I [Halapricum desulfuricans]|uniref:anthranilate synthase n=1 Tax=Halapricum desulfuricans TaxID=2841257 RepID=A0A897NY95_9EURY|nr:aminodeoxychorismate synthase, component I [Halapricum desulfuricans]QSG15056.1 Anthranilate/para-aminobenzoate synthase component I [Halapricum desulfuricans]
MSDPRVVTGRASFRETATASPDGARVPVEVTVEVADPFEAYRRARDGRGGVYLGTSGGRSGWGYFGVEPDRIVETSPGDEALATLDSAVGEQSLARGDCEVPYPCGVIGWLSYDIAREIESLPESTTRDRDLPRMQLGVYDRLVAWREPRGQPTTLHVTACPRVGDTEGAFTDPGEAYAHGRERALDLAEGVLDGDPTVGSPPVERDRATFESDCGRTAFADRVRRVKEHIREGDTFQANVSHRLTAPAAAHPVTVFEALRSVNPAPYSALLEFPGVDLVSASPELLLDRDGNRLETEPIAGTRPRGETPAADERLEAELTTDEKERAEHAMLVDLERNDLGKVSEYGSVEVSEYRRVDRYSEVMHLVSLVEGRLRAGQTLADAIEAVFPGGTITGAPKPRTMAIIDEVESTRRGPYTGSIGIFGFDDRATLNIVIRTLVRYGQQYHLRVGAGIVHDSDPQEEYQETLDKARALINAVDVALESDTDFAVGKSDIETDGEASR